MQEECDKPYDTTILVQGRKYLAHRKVLSENSPYFQAMFSSNFNARDRKSFRLRTFDHRTFIDVLDYLYKHECEFYGDIVDLMMVSELLILPSMNSYISVNLECLVEEHNCLDILHYALHCEIESTCLTVINIIVNQNLLITCSNPAYNWTSKVLKMLLSADHLRYFHKLRLLKYFKYWITADPLTRHPMLSDVTEGILSQEDARPSITEFAAEVRNLLITCEIKYVISPRPNFDLYIIGGHTFNVNSPNPFISHNELLTLHPSKNNTLSKRHSINRMITQRIHFASAFDKNGFYLIGGIDATGSIISSAEYYDYDEKRWFIIPELKRGAIWAAATSNNSRIYASGGLTKKNNVSASCYLYVPKHNCWKAVANMNLARRAHTMCSVNGFVYSIGGHNGQAPTNCVEMYSSYHNYWQVVAPMNVPRHRFSSVAVGKYIYVFGGLNFGGPIKTVERYDTCKDEWKIVAEIFPAYDLSVTAWDTDIFICGGFNGVHDLNNVVCFSTKSLVGRLFSQMKIARHGLTAFILPNNTPGNLWGQI